MGSYGLKNLETALKFIYKYQKITPNDTSTLKIIQIFIQKCLSTVASSMINASKLVTAHLNEKNLVTNSPWGFDANFDTSDSR